ncbi:MAG TPA: hypothetical protein VFV34_23710 [Blastocatellia bacterium]|nr:hypothetical protein [Blastocatellia bacterium]
MTRKIAAMLILLATLGAALVTYSLTKAQAEEPQSAGVEWEYLVVAGGNVNLSPSGSASMRKEPGAFSREWFALEQNFDKLGTKGWELVEVTGSPNDPVYFFKRRK